MSLYRPLILLLLLFSACGSTSPDTVLGYSASFLTYPTTRTALDTSVRYDRSTGAVAIAHSSLDANHTVLDSGTKILGENFRYLFDSILNRLELENYSDVYRSGDASAADSDGTSMRLGFSTAHKEMSIFIDTSDLTILPAPLADLYSINISLQLSNL